MKTLGSLLREARKERTEKTPEDIAKELGISLEEYTAIEKGESELEKWGRILKWLAIKLETPTSRFIARTGKAAQAGEEKVATLLKEHRETRKYSPFDRCEKGPYTPEEMADMLGISLDDYLLIEKGESPLEKFGGLMLHAAELVDLPVFNLLHPWDLDEPEAPLKESKMFQEKGW